jgi:putative FmdB family regulatory protein
MPLYEYECKECGHRFERIQSFSAESVKECPVCRGKVERLISAPAVHFKGSGFYSTDYGAKPAKDSAGSAADKSSKDGASGASEKAPSEKPATETSIGEKSSPAKTAAASSSAPAKKTSKR